MMRYGWFEYGFELVSNRQSITNYLTGQRITIRTTAVKDGGVAYFGIYSDNDIVLPISFSKLRISQSSTELTLDYRNTFTEIPAYGVWRRLDDFIVDALLCWPEFLDQKVMLKLIVVGGWGGGVYCSGLQRHYLGRKSAQPGRCDNYVIAEPFIIDINAEPPLSWKLKNVNSPATQAKLYFDYFGDTGIPYLPLDRDVAGFQGVVPYLERLDKGAYIIFSEIRSNLDRDGEPASPHLYYTYLDQELFFTFRSSYGELEIGTCFDYGFRTFPPSRKLWTVKPLGELIPGDKPRLADNVFSKYSNISYYVWLRVVHALGDAWPAWSTDKRVVLRDGNGMVGQIGESSLNIKNGYSAGMTNSWFSLQYRD